MTYEDQDCITCFVRFGVPHGFTDRRRKDKASFYCPNGHSMSYSESELDRVRRERDRLRQEAARRDDEITAERRLRVAAEERAASAVRKTKRMEKRAQAGVCPCCNRTFAALAHHMQSRHPDFRAEDVVRENVVSIVKGKRA